MSLITEAVLRLDQRTTMRLIDVAEKKEERSVLALIIGALQSFSRAPWDLAVNTPYVSGLLKGTEFLVRVEAEQTAITVFEGKVAAVNELGRLLLAGGESAVAKKGEAPQRQIVVRPRDAVQWALYYPPVLEPGRVPADAPPKLRKAMQAAGRGDTVGAFEALEGVPETEQGTRFHLYRAALLLNVGRVEEARADIDRALALDPKASLAYALRSVIGVVQNEQEQALTDGERAVALDLHSAAAHIALSYAQQARFQLEQARDTLLQAVKTEPENALAWARLAEIHSSFGHLDKALSAAQKAVALEPNLSRTQTVLGFAYLTQVKTARAKEAFDQAIALDQADPLPRLGLGLAKIRESDLHEGRGEIELAAGLDPNNSLVRSYLGKAYYEEKRIPLDEGEYAIAKELDSKDPTPWFYDAIAKQTTNRPVEALHDMEKTIELNDDRAVYRSRLLLDSDLAARSASLGRVYSDLGFQQLALVEGWKSVNT
ncbi:MAG: tetratricopeptide repeat protein, partial [Gammaproteobacteria bacterium]